MEFYLINYGLAFLEGFALIISPCILPILPLLLVNGSAGGKQRPFGIIIGFTLVFALFNFFANSLVSMFDINLNILRIIAFLLIVFLGIIMFFNYLSDKFSLLTQKISNFGIKIANKHNKNDLWSGVLFGALVSLIWAPCGGPVLTSAIIQMSIQRNISAIFTFFCFALGSIVPMMMIVIFGKLILSKLKFLSSKAILVRKILAILIIIFALLAAFSSDIFANTNPSLNNVKSNTDNNSQYLINAINPVNAPELVSNNNNPWLNSSSLTLKSLKGKVVLVEFWSYTCFYCRKTIPYLKDWYSKYHKDGLEIIGVHSPQYTYASSIPNVKKSIAKFNIPYPVLIDNQYKNFVDYGVRAWPTIYLINKQGQIVYLVIGEGDEDITEENIKILLH